MQRKKRKVESNKNYLAIGNWKLCLAPKKLELCVCMCLCTSRRMSSDTHRLSDAIQAHAQQEWVEMENQPNYIDLLDNIITAFHPSNFDPYISYSFSMFPFDGWWKWRMVKWSSRSQQLETACCGYFWELGCFRNFSCVANISQSCTMIKQQQTVACYNESVCSEYMPNGCLCIYYKTQSLISLCLTHTIEQTKTKMQSHQFASVHIHTAKWEYKHRFYISVFHCCYCCR